MAHDRLVREPVRHRVVVRVETWPCRGERAARDRRAAGELRDAGAAAQRGKPQLQRSLQATAAASFGPVPFEGPEVVALLGQFLNLTPSCNARSIATSAARSTRSRVSPRWRPTRSSSSPPTTASTAARTGSAARAPAAHQEGDPCAAAGQAHDRNQLTQATETPRTQLTSSVDIVPLLLTIATGSNEWRNEPRHEHLADRADLATMITDPAAPGRPFVVHATDETVTEYAVELHAAEAPRHVVAVRTPDAKYAAYSNWRADDIELLAEGEEDELDDDSTDGASSSTTAPATASASLRQTFEDLEGELRAHCRLA